MMTMGDDSKSYTYRLERVGPFRAAWKVIVIAANFSGLITGHRALARNLTSSEVEHHIFCIKSGDVVGVGVTDVLPVESENEYNGLIIQRIRVRAPQQPPALRPPALQPRMFRPPVLQPPPPTTTCATISSNDVPSPLMNIELRPQCPQRKD